MADGAADPLADALAEIGRIIESMPPHERWPAIDRVRDEAEWIYQRILAERETGNRLTEKKKHQPQAARRRVVVAERETGGYAVDSSWDQTRPIRGLDGGSLMHYPDGTWRFRHVCKTVPGVGTVICAPRLDPQHVVSFSHPPPGFAFPVPTVNPSVLCPDCGTHGFIREGEWIGCG